MVEIKLMVKSNPVDSEKADERVRELDSNQGGVRVGAGEIIAQRGNEIVLASTDICR